MQQNKSLKNVLLVYPPFCTPASPPYSITNICAFLEKNLSNTFSLGLLDLNIEYHKKKFKKFKDYYCNLDLNYNSKQYQKITGQYAEETKKDYSKNNKIIRNNHDPDLIDDLIRKILSKKPDFVALSIVFSSQVFYAYAIIKKLKKYNIKIIVGGPAVNNSLSQISDVFLNNELELLDYITGIKNIPEKLNYDYTPNYNQYNLKNYFSPKPVIPIRTSSGCYYKRCSFCTHHQNSLYYEYPLEKIKNIIEKSGSKHIFLTDDMIHEKRLIDIAKIIKPLDIKWMCQLKPTKNLDKKTMKYLYDSGLRIIIWGVESGCQRILDLMKKGTKVKTVEIVLRDSHDQGINNVVYVMFGFPSETNDEFVQTINFLQKNNENIDLISTSVFGLLKGTDIYNNPNKYFIEEIIENKRTILDSKLEFKVSKGLNINEINKLRKDYQPLINKVNKYPNKMNFFREHMLVLEE